MTTVSSTRVPFMDLSRQHGPLAGELKEAFDRVLGSSGFILGTEVEQFELEFAQYCGVTHAVGVASGTAALSIMLEAAGIGPGDEVVVPAHTFIASALAVVHAGATPVCADVDPATGLIDADAAAAAVGPRTAAILVVHLYGQPCDMDRLGAVARSRGLALFEDAAQAHGATYRGARAGGLATAGAFSFYPSKNLGALGDAGAICTDDDQLVAAARRLRDLGRSGPTHDVAGYNERLDGLQAAWLRIKLRHLDGWNAARRELAAAYGTALGRAAEQLFVIPEAECNYHLYPILTPDRDVIRAALTAGGISTGVHYPLALPDQPSLPMLHGYDAPHARSWAAHELSLPIFPGMTTAELEIVTSALLERLGQGKSGALVGSPDANL
jgi:dTDP-3-amino-3,4,6-trideoxy-alpha-D-glucose transaminase